MNWGKWIVVSFIVFAGFIATLVTVCVRQDVSLVSKDYYKEELAYQDQMARVKNGSMLPKKPTIKIIDQNTLQIDFDKFNEIEDGELQLFRPSNAAMDQKFHFSASDKSTRLFPMETMAKGMYRARMVWKMRGKEFFIEEVIFI